MPTSEVLNVGSFAYKRGLLMSSKDKLYVGSYKRKCMYVKLPKSAVVVNHLQLRTSEVEPWFEALELVSRF